MTVSTSCFPKRVRLLKPADFKRVFDLPVKQSGPGFLILARSNDLREARLGLAISKKCAKTAVQRNRIKRLIRENFRMIRSELPAADFVVVCRPGTERHASKKIAEIVSGLFSKLGRRLCENS